MLYLASFMITGLLLPLFIEAPSLSDRSLLSLLISSPIFSLIESITSLSSLRCLFPDEHVSVSNRSLTDDLVYVNYVLWTL